MEYFHCLVLALKLDGTAGEALQQIKEKGYSQPYIAVSRKKIAVGISFSSEKRAIQEYKTEEQLQEKWCSHANGHHQLPTSKPAA